jgi:hypothetical protein
VNDYHFSLSDGVTTLEFLASDVTGRERSLRYLHRVPLQRSSMRTGSGRVKWSDLEPPFFAIGQDDWSGGRGGVAIEEDPTEYYDANGIQAWIPERLVLGPKISTAWDSGTQYEADGIDPETSILAPFKYAQTFTISSAMTLRGVRVKFASDGFYGTLKATITGVISGSGVPDTSDVYGETEVIDFSSNGLNVNLPDTAWEFPGDEAPQFDFTEPCHLLPGQYAIIIEGTSGSGSDYFWWAGENNLVPNGSAWIYNAPSWNTMATFDRSFRLLPLEDPRSQTHFFTYKGLPYAVVSTVNGTAILQGGGQRGQCTAGVVNDYIADSSRDFSGLEGRWITIVDGTGKGQTAKIATGGNGYCIIDREWPIIPNATSVYVIEGEWDVVANFTGFVTDVLVVDEVVYLARGSDRNIRRYRWTNSSGHQTVDDGTNKADYLALFRDDDNDPAVWRALGHEVSNAAIQAWGTNLTFSTATRIGSNDVAITALTVYDDKLYIGKEDGIWALEQDVARQIPVDFAALRSPNNCKGMVPWNLYLIFPLLHGLERMYGSQVDDFGPNTGEGLPSGRQGTISAILPIPGALIVAIDGSEDGYSAVFMWNQMGWHEIARGTYSGDRITGLHYEVLPDAQIRLYWHEGTTIKYAWMSGRVFDRSRDTRADYTSSGEIITAWMGTDLHDVEKLWHEIAIFWERNGASIAVSYQLNDEEASWSAAGSTAPTAEPVVRFALDVTARRIRFKLTLTRAVDDENATPIIRAVNVEAVGRIPSRNAYNVYVPLEEGAVSLLGQRTAVDMSTVLAKLDEWAETPTALTLGLADSLPEFGDQTVFLEPLEVRIVEWVDGTRRHVLSLSMVQLGT